MTTIKGGLKSFRYELIKDPSSCTEDNGKSLDSLSLMVSNE